MKRPKISIHGMFFNERVMVRMNKAMLINIDKIVEQNPEIFNSRSHFIRAAINSKIKEGWEHWVL